MQAAMPLFDAVARRNASAVRRLLAEGADPNTISPLHGQSVLYNACITGDVESARALLESGADPNLRLNVQSIVDGSIERDVTVLMVVTSESVAALLLEFGADVNAQDSAGTTALMKAALFGKAGVAEILLRNGATTDIRQSGGARRTARELAETKLQFWRDHIGDPGMKQDGVQERIRAHEAILRMVQQNSMS